MIAVRVSTSNKYWQAILAVHEHLDFSDIQLEADHQVRRYKDMVQFHESFAVGPVTFSFDAGCNRCRPRRSHGIRRHITWCTKVTQGCSAMPSRPAGACHSTNQFLASQHGISLAIPRE